MIEQQFKQPRLTSSQSHFSKIPQANIPRSSFNRTSQYKTTFTQSGILYPIYFDEVLPGDTKKLRTTIFARLATPLKPFMDNLFFDLHFFFVPNRLMWTNWEKFNGAQTNPGDSTDFLTPIVRSGTNGTEEWEAESIADYLSWPTGVTPSGGQLNTAIAFYTRAYNLIYKEWYRDQNMINSPVINTGDGPDSIADYPLRRRGRRHDYFTSALPWPQKGNAVELPLGELAYVYGPDALTPMTTPSNTGNFGAYNATTGAFVDRVTLNRDNVGAVTSSGAGGLGNTWLGINPENAQNENQPYVDLSQATAATINQLREAITLQQLFERDARGGTRYIEILKSHFGVTSPDFRLQRPEFLGQATAMINTSPVPQTSESSVDSPLGDLAAMATFAAKGGFNHSFVEHGVILGLASVRADQTYQQGMNKMFTRRTRYDYYWPTFAHLGEQPIFNSEIYYQGHPNTAPNLNDGDDGIFGYQERWAEYRYKPSVVTGQFRSNFSTPLDMWHLAIDYAALPTLNETFINENPPVDRVIAYEGESGYPQFFVDCYYNQIDARPMPVYSIPGLDKL